MERSKRSGYGVSEDKTLKKRKMHLAFFKMCGTITILYAVGSRKQRVKYRLDGRLPPGEGVFPAMLISQPPK